MGCRSFWWIVGAFLAEYRPPSGDGEPLCREVWGMSPTAGNVAVTQGAAPKLLSESSQSFGLWTLIAVSAMQYGRAWPRVNPTLNIPVLTFLCQVSTILRAEGHHRALFFEY